MAEDKNIIQESEKRYPRFYESQNRPLILG